MSETASDSEDNILQVIKRRKIVDVKDESIPLEYPEKIESQLYKLPLASKVAQCSRSYGDLVFYNRAGMNSVVNKLSDFKLTRVIITGPPGVGKSTTAWHCALVYAQKKSNVCWVNVRTGYFYWLEHETGVIIRSTASMYTSATRPATPPDVLILDGATKEKKHVHTLREVVDMIPESQGLVIIVSSLQSNYEEDFTDYQTIEMTGWTEEEYLEAIKHEPFYKQVLPNLLFSGEVVPEGGYNQQEREDLVLRKFSIAGYSCRWMFDLSVEAVYNAIDLALKQVSNFNVLGEMLAGPRSVVAKNRLVMEDPKQRDLYRFTSALVAQKMARLKTADMPTLHRLVTTYGNRAMQGQALEIDFINALDVDRIDNRVKYIEDPAAVPQNWSAEMKKAPRMFQEAFETSFSRTSVHPDGRLVRFYHDVLNPDQDMHLIVVGSWMAPDAVNQGGFDCVQLCADEGGLLYLRFAQLTVQLNHPIKVYFMRTFLEDFNRRRAAAGQAQVCMVYEVVVILPMESAKEATPPWDWEIIGDQRTGTRYGANIELPFVRRVAGYQQRRE